MKKYCKNCPSCNKEMLYNNKYALNNSIKNDRNCKSCCQLKYEYTTNFNRNCPSCKCLIEYNNRSAYNDAITHNRNCRSCSKLGNNPKLFFTKNTIKKLRVARKKQVINHSEETKRRIAKSHLKENLSSESIENYRRGAIKRLTEFVPNQFVNFNRNACKIFDKLNNELNLNGHHAMNGGEKEISGYFVDYYEPIHNMVIEWDEPAHYENGKLKSKDIERQQIIEKKLKCNFIRVNQDNFNYDELKGKITKNSRLSYL
jgi:very-short-patch-repair endonuclease